MKITETTPKPVKPERTFQLDLTEEELRDLRDNFFGPAGSSTKLGTIDSFEVYDRLGHILKD